MAHARLPSLLIVAILTPMVMVLMVTGRLPASAEDDTGDSARGAALFRQCAACHSIEPGVQLTGPSLAAVWNRRAATVPGFGRYTEGLKHAGLTWDAATLDRWLARPQAVVPDTTMALPGIENARQRADIVAYLKALSEGKAPPPAGGGMMAARPLPDLKQVGKERHVTAIRHCGDAYHVTTEAGRTVPYWEFNLRFKTDTSAKGPERGKPVLVPQGMQGDRAQVVFSDLDDLKRFLVERCEETAR